MLADFSAFLFAALGTVVGAGIQYYFQRQSTAQLERREIIEEHLLQIQNAAESLYYRANNLLDRDGKSVMGEEYSRTTFLYIIGTILGHQALLMSRGIYAKLGYDEDFKRQLKANLHRVNRCLDDQHFLHYYRVQLAEMSVEGKQVLSYSDFLLRLDDERYASSINAASAFIASLSSSRLQSLRSDAGKLVALLESKTKVPSALTLAKEQSTGALKPGAAGSRALEQ